MNNNDAYDVPDTSSPVFKTRKNGQYYDIAIEIDNKLVHADRINPVKEAARRKFIDNLQCKMKVSSMIPISEEIIEEELIRLVSESMSPAQNASAEESELNLEQIIRPEMFHTQAVSGVLIPVPYREGDKIKTSLKQYMFWHADKRREVRKFERILKLPNGLSLYFDPFPMVQHPKKQPGWSIESRKAWVCDGKAINPVEIYERIAERIDYFIDFPPEHRDGIIASLALYVMLTYGYSSFRAIPYLAMNGSAGSGKSTVLEVMAEMVFRPLRSSNMTSACLFRSLNNMGGTLCLDEAETLRNGSSEGKEILPLLLSGYKKNSPASRAAREDENFVPVEFDVYGPKLLASIAGLPEALASRCIRIGTIKASAASPKPRRLIEEEPYRWQEIRDDLHIWALELGAQWIEIASQRGIVPSDFSARAIEIWGPLLSLASYLEENGAKGVVDAVVRYARYSIEAASEASINLNDEAILATLSRHVQAGSHRFLKAGDILRELREAMPTIFGKYTPQGISNAMRRYGIHAHRESSGRFYSRVTLGQLKEIQNLYNFTLSLPDCDALCASSSDISEDVSDTDSNLAEVQRVLIPQDPEDLPEEYRHVYEELLHIGQSEEEAFNNAIERYMREGKKGLDLSDNI